MTTQMTDQELQTIINVNKFDNNADRAAANVWEDINNFCEGKGGHFQVKTYLATLITALDRKLTVKQMEKVFPYGIEIMDTFGWTVTELFEFDIYATIFEGTEDDTCIVYDRTAELADATEGDLAGAEALVARNFGYALQNLLNAGYEQLPQLAAPANVLVKLLEHAYA